MSTIGPHSLCLALLGSLPASLLNVINGIDYFPECNCDAKDMYACIFTVSPVVFDRLSIMA